LDKRQNTYYNINAFLVQLCIICCCGSQRLAAKESARDPKVASDPPGVDFTNIFRARFSRAKQNVTRK